MTWHDIIRELPGAILSLAIGAVVWALGRVYRVFVQLIDTAERIDRRVEWIARRMHAPEADNE